MTSSLNWDALTFDIVDTNCVVVYSYKDGKWGDMELMKTRNMTMDLFSVGNIYYKTQVCITGNLVLKD
jgi:hypothetical protein